MLVPHLRDRPFTMKRYPDGWQGDFFFQKDAPVAHARVDPARAASGSRPASRRARRRRSTAPLVNDEAALLWMVNMACIDMNTWYSRVDRPDRPDWVLFDLDPSPDVGFPETVQVALLVKEILDALGLVGFPKTSGSSGIHVLVPVERRYTYDDTREFAEIVAGALARTHRGLVTTEWTKSKRRGVLVDANQNGEGKTIASVYSVRPRPGAPVSTPVRWEELTQDLDPASFTMDAVLERVRRDGDLYADVLKTRQRIDKALAGSRRLATSALARSSAELDACSRSGRPRRRLVAGVRAGLSEPYWRDYAEPGYEGRWNGLMVRGGKRGIRVAAARRTRAPVELLAAGPPLGAEDVNSAPAAWPPRPRACDRASRGRGRGGPRSVATSSTCASPSLR